MNGSNSNRRGLLFTNALIAFFKQRAKAGTAGDVLSGDIPSGEVGPGDVLSGTADDALSLSEGTGGSGLENIVVSDFSGEPSGASCTAETAFPLATANRSKVGTAGAPLADLTPSLDPDGELVAA